MEFNSHQVVNQDWLGTSPIFFNKKTLKVSRSINDVVDWDNFDFDPDGLNNYLDFGYSILGRTPIRDVEFLQANHSLRIENNQARIYEREDPVLSQLGRRGSEEDAINLISDKLACWVGRISGDIVVPTSGGFDSRLLNTLLIQNGVKSDRIKAFTYGNSLQQNRSTEVVYAKALCEKLGIPWGQIQLGDFLGKIDEWISYYGCSNHAHGMYHIEFYEKIRHQHPGLQNLLSGIIGDIWSGNLITPKILSLNDFRKMGYTHGMNSDSVYSKLKSKSSVVQEFLSNKRHELLEPEYRIVAAMRLKIMLLGYLMKIPTLKGFNPYSPFLEMDVATALLAIPENRRAGRVWQKEYFEKNGLDIESWGLKSDYKNDLNKCALASTPLEHLDVCCLNEIIDGAYVNWVNKTMSENEGVVYKKIYNNNLGRKILTKVGFGDKKVKAFSAYCTLLPLQKIIKLRNAINGK